MITGNTFIETGWNAVMSSESGEVNSTTGPPSWCRFQGVTCSTSSNYGSIESLDLAFIGMHGSLPNSINNFLNIKTMGFLSNSITGTLPNTISLLTALTHLIIESNEMIGTIPASIGSLTNLELFNIRLNSFTGIIPSSITTLTRLSYLNLARNFLTGTIPTDFSVLGALGALDLSWNYLSMGQLTTLPVSTFPSQVLDPGHNIDITNNCLVFYYESGSQVLSSSANHCKQTSQPTLRKSNSIRLYCSSVLRVYMYECNNDVRRGKYKEDE